MVITSEMKLLLYTEVELTCVKNKGEGKIKRGNEKKIFWTDLELV